MMLPLKLGVLFPKPKCIPVDLVTNRYFGLAVGASREGSIVV